jgi:hypothetical protein
MSVPETYRYTDEELRSYLPTGWELIDGGEAAWDEKRRATTLRVLDNVHFDWPVTVRAGEVDRVGRLEALRLAFDQVFRDRLGKPTRGLGLGG